MNGFWEKLLGLRRGFLSLDGEFSRGFNPKWPADPLIDAGAFNWLLGLMAVFGIAYLIVKLRKGFHLSVGVRRSMVAGVVALTLFAFTLISGTIAFNVALGALALGLLFYVYPREGRSRGVRIALACVRAAVLAFVIALLNRPVLNLGQD